jgi:Fe-S-cluster-containing hydrogenase component 2
VKVLIHDPSRCTGCHTCEGTCAAAWFREADRVKSAIRILDPDASGTYGAVVCNQCGECIDVCPTMALRRTGSGVVRIARDLCVGCLSCVGFCPIWAMRTHPDQVEPYKCVACGRCARACPEGALRIEDVADVAVSETARWVERKGVR